MPREKPFLKPIPAFYKRNAEDLMMYAFVEGVRTVLPSMQIKSIIDLFKKKFELDDDDYPVDCAQTTHTTMQRIFFESKKEA